MKQIELRQLTLGYGERILLDKVNATIAGGELVALLGRNGTGKSTLLRAIAGLEPAMNGEIRLCGSPLQSLSPRQLAQTVSFVTTEKVRIANLTGREVVGLGRAPYTDWLGRLQPSDCEVVSWAIEAVGMSALADNSMDRLSDGEAQRMMIARALAQQTPIVLLDEPTAFLDMPNRYELCTLLRRLAHDAQRCILFSTHELDIALTMCDSIALIDAPQLPVMPTAQMVQSGHIERLFGNSIVSFDAEKRQVRVRE